MGKVWKFGHDIDTDIILPARYLNKSTPEHLAAHCMEDAGTSFAQDVKTGDVMVGGKNFGCGSSREHAPIAIKVCGIQVVIAESFARIFYRNAINIGLPIMECPEAAAGISQGDEVEVDVATGIIENRTTNMKYQANSFPPFMQDLIRAGGLIPYIEGRNKNA
ncbi:3-isopropylmalate dehydratase small subunit [Desulfosporosinus fructosivorans]|uniref:3-isopropylmalate dehydratase small subunit n=1 Tax=Desulfosporosinus fructosivorans TaxID=2018669 RepID=A0A4Z0R8M5_9FIRM|nr:3-isopropylmalate dehydratase small subunit [Desulfosporosinus fructosivorans]TGE38785.1 3-isopropylmalate dehydratase small subunit [Desulfosporosinus fructosivorans]